MITTETLQGKRKYYQSMIDEYQRSIYALQGAVQAIDELLSETETLDIHQLKAMTGAAEIGEPVPVGGAQ